MSKKAGKPKFDAAAWAEELADCIALELGTWRVRMAFDTIRALAIQCHPWHEKALTISFLTDRELFDEAASGKWALADWRMYDFTSGPSTHWPSAEELLQAAYDYYLQGEEERRAEEVRDELVSCCAQALRSAAVADALKQYQLAPDFELFAGHPDAPKQNFCSGRRRTKR